MWPFKKKKVPISKDIYRIEFSGVTINGATVVINLKNLQELFVEAWDDVSAQKEFAAHINLPYKYIHSVKKVKFNEAIAR